MSAHPVEPEGRDRSHRDRDTVWRLLDTGPLIPSENLAFDEALLTACDEGKSPNTLRFLEWSEPCVLVGRDQAVELEVRETYCRQHGIAIHRRLTGGGAVLCDGGQLGWEVIARKDAPGLPARPEERIALFREGAVRALRSLSLAASFRPRNGIQVKGRKISGTGGAEKRRAFLFQGTLPVGFDVETMARALRVSAENRTKAAADLVRERFTCLQWELDPVPDLGTVKRAMAKGLQEVLGVTFQAAGPSPHEERLLRELLPRLRSTA